MQALLNKYQAVDPTGTAHEIYSEEVIFYVVFGKLKNDKTWLEVASSDRLITTCFALDKLKKTWRAGAEFAIAEVTE